MSEQIKLVNGRVKEFADMECALFQEALGDMELNEVWTAIEWETSIKKGHVYGGKRDPAATKKGRRENTFKLKMFLEAWELIKKKLQEQNKDPLLVKFNLTVAHGEADQATKVTRLKLAEFTKDTFAMDNEDTDGNFIELEGLFPGKPEEDYV